MVEKESVLFFAPFSGIWKHSLSEYGLIRILKNKYKVYDIRCDRYFREFCTVMNNKNLDLVSSHDDKEQICFACKKNAKLLNVRGITRLELEVPINDLNINSTIASIYTKDFKELYNLEFNSIPVGRIAVFESIIKYKKTDFNFSEEELAHYRTKVIHALKASLIADAAANIINPKFVFIHSPQYAVGGSFGAYFERKKIKVYAISQSSNASERYRSVMLWNWNKHKLNNPAKESWVEGTKSVSKSDLKRASRHLKYLKTGNSPFTYSAKYTGNSIRTFFGLSKTTKIFLLATSSYDEVHANYSSGLSKFTPFNSVVYQNQVDWIKSTINFFAKKEGSALVIRLHPREFPNNRDSVPSSHGVMLENILKNLPSNVFVDHPSLGLSVYDYFDEIQCVITGFSSVGLEAMLAGIPCVSYDSSLIDIPEDIHFTGSSQLEYFTNIDKAFFMQDRKKIMYDAIHWLAYMSALGSVRVPSSFNDLPNFLNFRFNRKIASKLEAQFTKLFRWIAVNQIYLNRDKHKLLNMLSHSSDSLINLEK
jgi:hypothetical protein